MPEIKTVDQTGQVDFARWVVAPDGQLGIEARYRVEDGVFRWETIFPSQYSQLTASDVSAGG